MAELGGGGEPFGAGVAVARAGAAVERNIASANMAFAVAAVGGELVPLGGLGVVLRNAETVGVEFANSVIDLTSLFSSTRLVASPNAVR
jgi:hypothetical protein